MSAQQRQPWPMKWVAVAILLLIVPYTIITLKYRKTAPAFRPYEDMQKRANVSRLLAAGYQRIPLAAERPAESSRVSGGAASTSATGGLPADLRSTLVETPLLPLEITDITAAPVANTLQPYAIQFTCTLPDDKRQLVGADLYVRGEQLVLAPTFDYVADGLLTRTRHSVVLITIPAGAVKSGHFTITLVGERSSRTWALEVK